LKKLAIGAAVHDDFDGIFWSLHSIRINNIDLLDQLEFIIVDNSPDSEHGKETKKLADKIKGKYIPFTEYKSTSIRNLVFENSSAEFTLCIDSHVLFEVDTIRKLLAFISENPNSQDLYHGPMLYDHFHRGSTSVCSHMAPVWRASMYGIWDHNPRAYDPDGEPYEIPMHGMGIFMCKTSAWLGFNKNFRSFGGEEGYIHKKFRKAGRKTYNLPFLRWNHRFQRPNGVNYPLSLTDRIRNYLIGHTELGQEYDDIFDHFGFGPWGNVSHIDLISEVHNMDISVFEPDKPFIPLTNIAGEAT
jgi:hypothetical protein